ncbi:MAG: ATP-dependent DNA helicase, partial [Deltaproteobacteria bacterium]|nr:ATP-dependent DNA helicase [Deltaproteobacteria bacterium]
QEEPHDEELRALVMWGQTTLGGSRADFPGLPSAEAWELVASEADACPVSRCSEFSNCFFYNARRQAAQAQLLVVNHHLLMADLQLPDGVGILPRYEALIVDEAHHLEDAATGYLGENISEIGLLMQLNRLAHRQRRELGLLRRLRRYLGQGPSSSGTRLADRRRAALELELYAVLTALLETEAEPAVLMLSHDLHDYFATWRNLLKEAFGAAEGGDFEESFKLRITARERGHVSWRTDLAASVTAFLDEAASVVKTLLQLGRKIEYGLQDKFLPEDFFAAWYQEFIAALNRFRSQVDFISGFFLKTEDDAGTIAWVEVSSGRRRNCRLVLAPLEVGSLLEKLLYQRLNCMIMVSATLAVDRSFAFFIGRVGLAERSRKGSLQTMILASPFDYRHHALIAVPNDLPLPNERSYVPAVALFLDALIARLGGRTLVLFTSYRTMREVACGCRDSLLRRGVRLLLQGEGQRQWLLNELKNNLGTVLFATDSFWEGVDVRGRALECLVVVRLPFKVPTEPVLAARLEYVAACGGNPFYDYTLPQTALKLKQGVGRLIRSRKDRGVIVICDRRLVEKNYGSRLLAVLPEAELQILSGGELVSRAAAFISQG